MRAATAEAHPNIALVKYWGKRDEALHLPYRGSLSVTLGPLRTRTRVALAPGLEVDRVWVQGQPAGSRFARRIQVFLDRVRRLAGATVHAEVATESDVPMAAGLASSSAGFAALALAASRAYGLTLGAAALSRLARQGSGSACRSIHGGFVEWLPGVSPEGEDSLAVPVAPAQHWDLAVVIAVVDDGPKPVSSREAMARCVATSPLFRAWLRRVDRDLPVVRDAVLGRHLDRLGEAMEANTLAMFVTMWTARPPVWYWKPGTVEVMQAVRMLRERGVGAWFTADAGPNVKVLCEGPDAPAVARALKHVPGVEGTLECRVGGPARWVSDHGVEVPVG